MNWYYYWSSKLYSWPDGIDLQKITLMKYYFLVLTAQYLQQNIGKGSPYYKKESTAELCYTFIIDNIIRGGCY